MGNYERQCLHIYLFPFMAHGHILPTIDMAKLFASRGLIPTVITTPLNAPNFISAIQKLGRTKINVKTLNYFPSLDHSGGLPQGCENLDSIKSQETLISFFRATRMLQQPLEQLLSEECPDCLVADMFFPWATDVADKFGIPRLVFHGTSFFSLCTSEIIRLHEPHNKVSSDSEPFVIPLLPHNIQLTRAQLPDHFRGEAENELLKLLHESKESETRSYGVVVNSFYELEPAYADLFRDTLKRRAWAIGPVSLCNRDIEEKAQRGTKKPMIDGHLCLTWLDSKDPGSVVYVCFGSVARLSKSQLREIGLALEASGRHFVWVVRGDDDQSITDGIGSGGKGLIIRDWAPQVLILDHKAVGAFVTHCGWNSTLEGITAGVPMVTWPVSAEQFYNEKLVTHVLRIGVPVGAKHWIGFFGNKDVDGTVIERNAIEKAVKEVMEGEEAKSLRERAKAFAGMARKAVEEGGSSHNDLSALIQQLITLKHAHVGVAVYHHQ